MPLLLTARECGIDDTQGHHSLVVGLAEEEGGEGWALLFQSAYEPPDDQSKRLGLDSYSTTTEAGATEFGGVRQVNLEDGRLVLVFDPLTAEGLGLAESIIHIELAIDVVLIDELREKLPRVFSYGRAGEHPELRGFH